MNIRNWLGVFGMMTLTACMTSGMTAGSASGTAQQAVTSGGSTESSIVFRNRSNWAIFHLHMSPTSQTTWGPDQLGASVLRSGGSFTLHSIPCNNYDIKLIDEDGDECVVHNVNVCAEDSGWNIDNDELLSCQAFTRQGS
jgi:hypothetical protein